MVTACTSPSAGKKDSVARLSNLPFTGSESDDNSGLIGASEAVRALSRLRRGEPVADATLEGLGSGEGSALTSVAFDVDRPKKGLPNGRRAANSSQSGLTHSVRGTNVDIKTVPLGGDAPSKRGRSGRLRVLS